MDWLSFGLPWDGSAQLVGAEINMQVRTCLAEERILDVRTKLSPPDGTCVVIDAAGIVAGVLTGDAVQNADPHARAEEIMAPDPTTVRPSEEIEGLRARLQRVDVAEVLVARSDGWLLGRSRP